MKTVLGNLRTAIGPDKGFTLQDVEKVWKDYAERLVTRHGWEAEHRPEVVFWTQAKHDELRQIRLDANHRAALHLKGLRSKSGGDKEEDSDSAAEGGRKRARR